MSNTKRILVIDDDPMFRNLIVTMLRRDFLVAVAMEGSEGFYKALEHVPDVVFVDIRMPGWDGLKTLKAFRGHPALSGVKIVMLTADASKETVLAAIHSGASDYLIKTHLTRESLLLCLGRLFPDLNLASSRNPEPAQVAPPSSKLLAPRAARNAVAAPQDDQRVQEILDSWE